MVLDTLLYVILTGVPQEELLMVLLCSCPTTAMVFL